MKVREFQHCLGKEGISVAIFVNTGELRKDLSIQYFCGVAPECCVLSVTSSSSLLFVPGFEVDRFREESRVRVEGFKSFKECVSNCVSESVSSSGGCGVVGLNFSCFSLREKLLVKSRVVDVGVKVCALRMQKTSQEIVFLKKAVCLAESVFESVCDNWSLFKTESDVYSCFLSECIVRDCVPSFLPVVASGVNAGEPHHVADGSRLRGFTVFDFGVVYKGYCSDITRTVFVGVPSKKDLEVYDLVLRAQSAAISVARNTICSPSESHVQFQLLHKAACDVLGKYKKYFTHSLGHGIGVEVHEAPSVSLSSKDVGVEGVVFTVEPGLYTSRFGIRIEDDVVLEKSGVCVLSQLSRNLRLFSKK